MQELNNVVKHCRVRPFAIDNREGLCKIALKNRRVELGFASRNPILVALQRVDLAVMNDVAIRMSALPSRHGIGAIARMYKRDGRFS